MPGPPGCWGSPGLPPGPVRAAAPSPAAQPTAGGPRSLRGIPSPPVPPGQRVPRGLPGLRAPVPPPGRRGWSAHSKWPGPSRRWSLQSRRTPAPSPGQRPARSRPAASRPAFPRSAGPQAGLSPGGPQAGLLPAQSPRCRPAPFEQGPLPGRTVPLLPWPRPPVWWPRRPGRPPGLSGRAPASGRRRGPPARRDRRPSPPPSSRWSFSGGDGGWSAPAAPAQGRAFCACRSFRCGLSCSRGQAGRCAPGGPWA